MAFIDEKMKDKERGKSSADARCVIRSNELIWTKENSKWMIWLQFWRQQYEDNLGVMVIITSSPSHYTPGVLIYVWGHFKIIAPNKPLSSIKKKKKIKPNSYKVERLNKNKSLWENEKSNFLLTKVEVWLQATDKSSCSKSRADWFDSMKQAARINEWGFNVHWVALHICWENTQGTSLV